MDASSPRPPPAILAAAAAGILVALLDAADTVLGLMGAAGTGAVFGTLVRDVVLVMAAVFLLRGAPWSRWVLGILLALSLVRVVVADEWLDWAGLAFALAGLVALLLPDARAWFERPVPGMR